MWEGARAVARFLLPLLVVASFLLSLDAAAADEGGEAAAVQTLFDVSDSLKAAVTAGDEALARELRTTIKGIQGGMKSIAGKKEAAVAAGDFSGAARHRDDFRAQVCTQDASSHPHAALVAELSARLADALKRQEFEAAAALRDALAATGQADAGGDGGEEGEGGISIGICSQMFRPGKEKLEAWLGYHFVTGFTHAILFLDDASDEESPGIAKAVAATHGAEVTIMQRGAALEKEWHTLATFEKFKGQVADDHMARQILNAGVAVKLAREMGVKWLLHIDDDELFYTQHLDVQAHFQHLDALPMDQAIYLNMEAVPAKEEVPELHFTAITTFKRNPHVYTKEVRANPQP
ncbi:hypothetical protein T484DRAFT_2206602 [Baffinella frigidus]|nr:hypothetical protein T484DRAFT_2206602 [Cryptophyta sp. CCMP2293]